MRDLPIRIVEGPAFGEGPDVVDDFGDGFPVMKAELDAVEAFLMAALEIVLASEDGAGAESQKGFQSGTPALEEA
jgi:hypothetical protein